MSFEFFYDETEHSRKINLNTLRADNFYDNFTTVIIGWDDKYREDIEKKYISFEEKYQERKSKGELKSTTLSQRQFNNGFASMTPDNLDFIFDFLNLFDDHVYWCFSVQSKVEYIIHQLFAFYKNNMFLDADAVKYTIIKAINIYKPERVMECLYGDEANLIEELRIFLEDRIKKNKEDILLKASEIAAFEQLLMVLKDATPLITEEWDYCIPFEGFHKYLKEQGIEDYSLIIDQEGNNHKTLNAAIQMGHMNSTEGDSKSFVGIRMADMLAGILSKFMKSIHCALQSDYQSIKKVVLNNKWFSLNQKQKALYNRFHFIISELNDSWDKSYAGIYTDDLISFIAFLEFIDEQPLEQLQSNNEMPERFNSYCIECLQGRFEEIHQKLQREYVSLNEDGCFINRWGAKVYADASKQPCLVIEDGKRVCEVFNAGFDRRGIATITISEDGEYRCYRIPDQLGEWAINMVAFKNMGQEIFPAKVCFSKCGSTWCADIL